jgi:hypothetical protein
MLSPRVGRMLGVDGKAVEADLIAVTLALITLCV